VPFTPAGQILPLVTWLLASDDIERKRQNYNCYVCLEFLQRILNDKKTVAPFIFIEMSSRNAYIQRKIAQKSLFHSFTYTPHEKNYHTDDAVGESSGSSSLSNSLPPIVPFSCSTTVVSERNAVQLGTIDRSISVDIQGCLPTIS
jgi:hypothetical protein